MVINGAEDAEAIHYVVRDEVGGGVAGLAVVAVVVALALLYVVGEGVRNPAVLAVAGDEVGDVVAHHPPEQPALVALVGEVVPDVGRGGDADLDLLRVAARFYGRVVDVLHGPLQDDGVGELEDEAVGLLPDEAKGLGAVAGHPDVELSVLDPRYLDVHPAVVRLPALGEVLYDAHRRFKLAQR